MRWGFSVSMLCGDCLPATMWGGSIRCRPLAACMGDDGRGVGPSARVPQSAGSGPPLGASVGGVGPSARVPQSAGSGPPLGECARGGSAALVGSVGRPPCVLARFAPCARGGVLPPRLLGCLPLRAPPRSAALPPPPSAPSLAALPPRPSSPMHAARGRHRIAPPHMVAGRQSLQIMDTENPQRILLTHWGL